MRLSWIFVVALACRALCAVPRVFAPSVVVVNQPRPACAGTGRCDESCSGRIDRVPGPGDCDGCPPGTRFPR